MKFGIAFANTGPFAHPVITIAVARTRKALLSSSDLSIAIIASTASTSE